MTWAQTVRVPARTRRKRRDGLGVVGWRVAVFGVAIAVWFLVSTFALLPATLVPNPWEVLVALLQAVLTAEYWSAIGATLGGALVGLTAATIVGIPAGVITGRFARAELSARFLFDFGRAFPAIALVAILVLLLGRGIEMKSLLVFIAVVFPMAIQTQHGVRSIDPTIVETARAFMIPQRLFIRRVLLPSAAPSILTGLRLAASVSVLVAISAEVLTNAPGVGERIGSAQVNGNAPIAFAYILTAGVLGYLINVGVGRVQMRVVRWRPANGGDN